MRVTGIQTTVGWQCWYRTCIGYPWNIEQRHSLIDTSQGRPHLEYISDASICCCPYGLTEQTEYSVISGNENEAFLTDSAQGILQSNEILNRQVISLYGFLTQVRTEDFSGFMLLAWYRYSEVNVSGSVPEDPVNSWVELYSMVFQSESKFHSRITIRWHPADNHTNGIISQQLGIGCRLVTD